MTPRDPQPALKPLHADDSLIQSKLEAYGKLATQDLIDSLTRVLQISEAASLWMAEPRAGE
jgi:hypothetical protein